MHWWERQAWDHDGELAAGVVDDKQDHCGIDVQAGEDISIEGNLDSEGLQEAVADLAGCATIEGDAKLSWADEVFSEGHAATDLEGLDQAAIASEPPNRHKSKACKKRERRLV